MKRILLVLIISTFFLIVSDTFVYACTPNAGDNCCYDRTYQSECTDVLSSTCGGGSCTNPCKNYIHCGARVFYGNTFCYNTDGVLEITDTIGPLTDDSYDAWYCGGRCTCCTPSCGTCTPPSCPTGYTATDPNNLCTSNFRNNTSCDNGDDGCGGSCGTSTRNCYLIETNTTFLKSDLTSSGPASIKMTVDGKEVQLSTDPNNPTLIKKPANGSTNIQLTVPTFTAALTSSGGGYYFQADNYGVNNVWEGWTTCSGIAGEDFCIDGGTTSTSNTITFTPTSQSINTVLAENAKGKISAQYYTVNKCDTGKQYSVPTVGYYVVDTLPDPPEPCTPGNSTCTILTDIGVDATVKGCTSTTYTGNEVNNPLHFNIDITDEDGISDIQGLIVWFSKDTSTPATVTIAGSAPNADEINDIGIFIQRNGSSWDTPFMYGYDSTSKNWEQTTDGNIKNSENEIGMKIEKVTIIPGSSSVNFDFKLEFFTVNTNPQGIYNLYLSGLDTNMINSNIVDQSYLTKVFSWSIDLIGPTAEDITQQIIDPTNTNITWSVNDSTSGILKTMINGYRVGGEVFGPATLFDKNNVSLSPKVLPTTIPADSEIGKFNDTNAWSFGTNNTGETDRLNIGTNEKGEIALYLTTYDNACNTNGTGKDVSLNPWFATRGGSIYSQGNINTSVQNVAGLPYLDGVFNPKTYMSSTLIDLGTELISSRNTFISNLVHIDNGAVKAISIEDTTNSKDYWFNQLFRKFSKYQPELNEFAKKDIDTKVSDSCMTGDKCYMYSTEDIYIPANYVCDKPTLFMTETNIHISPNVTSTNNTFSGCIFLAENNIYVDGGTFKSTGSKVLYDLVEGYLIADNQVIFTIADDGEDIRDGIEILGGVVALGTNPTSGESAFTILRNLRLYSQINPTVVITYDSKYSIISTIFFGTEYNLYKQEVGFKPF